LIRRLLRLQRLQQAAGNDDYDDYVYDEGRYLFFDSLLKEKNLLIPAAAGSSPSMQLLVFWPLLALGRWHYFSALRSALVV